MTDETQVEHLRIALKQALKYVLDNGEKLVAQAEKAPPDVVATRMLVPLLNGIYSSARSEGVEVSTETILAVGIHVIRAMAELFIMSGVLKESEAKDFASKVTQAAIKQHNGSK